MDPAEIEKRLGEVEARLARIESQSSRAAAPAPAQAARPAVPKPAPAKPESGERPSLVTSFLGWGGAVALVLAAAYLIRLAVESGWLTPVRQVTLAAVAGLAMIAAGFVLRNVNRQYAGLLPAGGVAILFLSIYGAHLFYGFVEAAPATVAVI